VRTNFNLKSYEVWESKIEAKWMLVKSRTCTCDWNVHLGSNGMLVFLNEMACLWIMHNMLLLWEFRGSAKKESINMCLNISKKKVS